jgi:bifunctional DNA-binding transcriptional regulator/antitoxin component of YhaV-PrlF toxin-antitoxin module
VTEELRMKLIKLGKKGRVSLPQGVLRQLGLAPETPLPVETTEDGAIVLRQVSAHPIEIYSDERLAEFKRENELMPEQAKRYAPVLADFSGWLRAQAESKRAAARPVAAKRPPGAAKR